MCAFSTLKAKLEMDASGFRSELESAEDGASSFEDRMQGMGRSAQKAGGILSATVTAPLVALGTQATRAAADAEELGSRAEAIFGEMSEDMEDWAETTAEEMGRSRRQMLDHAAQMQDLIDPTGEMTEETYELSQGMAELSQDVASFQNMDPDQVMEKFQSAMAGQSRAVRDLGVDLSQSAVEAELMAMGIEGGTEAANDAQEAQARYNVLVEETQAAHGDAQRTSDTFTGTMRQLRGEVSNLAEQYGEHLLPAATLLLSNVQGLISGFGDLSENQQQMVIGASLLAAAIGPVLLGLGTLGVMAPAVASGFGLLAGGATWAGGAISGALLPASVAGQGGLYGLAAAALAANVALGPITVPIYAIVGAIGALLAAVAGFAVAYRKNWMNIRDTTEWMIDPILSGIDTFIESIFGISDATGQVADGFADFLGWIIDQVNKVPGVDIDGDGFTDFSMDTDMDGVDTDELGQEMSAEDMMPDDLDGVVEEDVSKGAEAGIVEGLIDGIEESDVKEQLKTEIQEAQDEIDEISAGATGVEGWEEVDELESEIADFEEQIEHLEDGGDIQDIDIDIVAQVAEDDLEAEEQRMAWEAELAETLGEDVDMDFDRDESIEDLDEQLQEELDRELKTQEDQHEVLERIKDLLTEVRDNVSDGFELTDIDGEIETDEGHIVRIVDGRLNREARRGDII